MKKEIDFILENLSNERFSISELIDISFILKKLLKGNEISFSDLIKPSGGIYWENISIIIPYLPVDRKSTRLNSSHSQQSRMPSSA